jgi:hypothetical protein
MPPSDLSPPSSIVCFRDQTSRWQCNCQNFARTRAQYGEGFCVHIALALASSGEIESPPDSID